MLRAIRNILIIVFLVSFVLVSLLGYKVYKVFEYKNPEIKLVYFEKGSSLKKISKILFDNKVVGDDFVFQAYARVRDVGHLLKAGEYEFDKGLSLDQVLRYMKLGKVKMYKVTIPEGLNINDICALFVKNNLMTEQECQEEQKNLGLIKNSKGIETLEGYLFPDTYYYHSQTKPKDFFRMMVELFYKKIEAGRAEKIKKLKLSLHEVVTLASVIEKETGLKTERGLIAGVFFNRLERGMLLQSDPTVIYGIKNFDGNIRKSDLLRDTPYNTYTRPGLPKGPICSVGTGAIDAVLNPVKSDYLYFVAKGDGSHYFSKSLEEHNRAVQKYQLGR